MHEPCFYQQVNQDIISMKNESKKFLHILKDFCKTELNILFLYYRVCLCCSRFCYYCLLLLFYFKWHFPFPVHHMTHVFFHLSLVSQVWVFCLVLGFCFFFFFFLFFCQCYLLMCYIDFLNTNTWSPQF